MDRRIPRIAAVLALIAIIAGIAFMLRGRSQEVVEMPPPTAGPTMPPLPQLGYTPVPDDTVSPIVVSRSPARGAELPPDGAIELVFDRPMDRAAVEASFRLSPAIDGTIQWSNAQTLRFLPAQPLPRAAVYDVVLDQGARAEDGAQLNSAYHFRFATTGYLEVGQVIPADGAQDVEADSTITVIFNRPVIALTTVEQMANAPQPLTFDPPIAGRGEWLSTAVYQFFPEQPLAGGSRYTGIISADLRDLDGNPLSGEYRWSFSVARPEVTFVSPNDDATLVSVEPVIRVNFNQAIDPASAESAFHLRVRGGSDVPGALDVQGATLTFTPTQRLAFDTQYLIELDAGLGGQGGGAGLRSSFTSSFRTVPLPRILETIPANNERKAYPYTDFAIRFNAPIDADTVMANLTMTPPISATQVYTYFDSYNQSFHLIFGAQPSTDYQVEIGPNIADPYGNTTGQAMTVSFTTDALPPSVNLVTNGMVSTYDAARPTRLGLNSVNQSSASLQLYRLKFEDIHQPYQNWDSRLAGEAPLRDWQVQLSAPLNESTLTLVDLVEGGGSLEPGVYAVRLQQEAGYNDTHILVVSSVNLTVKSSERDVLVWANDLQSGEPVANLTLRVLDDSGTQLGTTTTDASGVAQLRLERSTNIYGIVVLGEQPFTAGSANWNSGISPWEFGIDVAWDLPEFTTHLYTDRPIYRPGQTVSFKGVVRAEDDVRFDLPAQFRSVDVYVRSVTGEQLFQQTIQLSQYGTFAGEVKLPEGAALGPYSIEVAASGYSSAIQFQVAAYRPPEFQVTVTPSADEIVRGNATTATAEVSYFFGGPVANAPVQWNVMVEPYNFSPPWAANYQFRDTNDPWSCRYCWWMPAPLPEPILSGSGVTDAQGRLIINIPAALTNSQGQPISDSVRLIVEATATGRDQQVISGRGNVIVHSGQLYVGVSARQTVGRAGQPQPISLVSATTSGERLPNQAIDVEIYRYTWENTFVANDRGGGSWEWTEQRTLVERQRVTTDGQAQATLTFTPAEGGSYRVVASARDAAGNTVRAAQFVWIAGEGAMTWRRDNNDRITLIADKNEYRPGETATVLIPSPFDQPHWALITVERGGVLSHEVRRVTSSSIVYELPITAQHAPNIFVSAVLFNPPQGNSQLADFKMGMVPLAISAEQQSLQISLSAEPAQAEPGETVRYEVQVTNSAGQPVAAELSLDLVDKAVLSLMPRTPNAIGEAFYGRRALAVRTSSGLSVSGDRLLERFNEELKQQQQDRAARGGGGADDLQGQPPAMPAAPAPAALEEAAPAMEDAGSYAQPGQAPAVRQEFADTAYWNASVTTDASGRTSVEVKLPDNLTTWVMRGVGLTSDTRVGEGTAELVATKPVLIRPVTPRFLVVGDRAEFSANISNNTDAPLSAQVALATTGLSVTSPLTQSIQIAARSEASVQWQVEAQDVESVDAVFSVQAGQYSDASRPRLATGPNGTLRVFRYSAPEVVGTGGQLVAGGSRTEVVALPPNIDTSSGELTVRLDPSLAAGMRDGLSYLEHYIYECTEQTVSRFLPNILTYQAMQRLGLRNAELEAKLPNLVREGVQRLANQQHSDGGWGWWPDNQSNPHVSAYVVFGLHKAKEAGYDIDGDVLNMGLAYLAGLIKPADELTSTALANQQAWLLYVLTEAGRSQSTQLNELFEARDKLSSYARAYLAMALHTSDANGNDERIKTLLSDLNNAAILSATGAHWEEEQFDPWGMNTDTRSTAIILAAFTQIDPENQLNPNIVRWLMVARTDGIWQTTQETAWSLIALTDWMEHTKELDADYDYAIWLNEQERSGGHIGKDDVGTPIVLKVAVADLLQEAGNRLTVGRGEGTGRLYYTAHLRAYLPAAELDALDRGLIVQRRYTLASCTDGAECPEVTEAKVGDVLRVELTIIAPHDRYYVALEDPLPAGAEAIDTNLATTSMLDANPELTRVPSGPVFAEGGPIHPFWRWWNWYSRSELRDEKVALFADYLPKGSYVYAYTMRLTTPGEFQVIPTTASEMYFPEVYGRSEGRLLRVTK